MTNIVTIYQQIADSVAAETGASDSLIHVHAGMLILLLARLVTGKSLGTFVPLTAVVLAAIANEILDYLYQGDLFLPDACYDLLNTLFWPLVLMVGIKIRAGLKEPIQSQSAILEGQSSR